MLELTRDARLEQETSSRLRRGTAVRDPSAAIQELFDGNVTPGVGVVRDPHATQPAAPNLASEDVATVGLSSERLRSR